MFMPQTPSALREALMLPSAQDGLDGYLPDETGCGRVRGRGPSRIRTGDSGFAILPDDSTRTVEEGTSGEDDSGFVRGFAQVGPEQPIGAPASGRHRDHDL